MNKSVSAYALKDRTFSKTLLTRVTVTGTMQGSDNEKVWPRVVKQVDPPFDQILSRRLANTDRTKSSKVRRQASKKGKSRRSANRHKKVACGTRTGHSIKKEGIAYEAGIAMKNAMKAAGQSVSNKQRNPKGTTESQISSSKVLSYLGTCFLPFSKVLHALKVTGREGRSI